MGMRLRSAIFWWVMLAIVAPLSALVLLATWFSEAEYQTRVDEQIYANLSHITSSFDRRLSYERDVLMALTQSPILKQYLPVLVSSNNDEGLDDYAQRHQDLEAFLKSFQSVLASVGSIRVLNQEGNSLMRVRFGETMPLVYEGIGPYRYAEQELDDEDFLHRLREIPAGDLGYLLQESSRGDFREQGELPMLDLVIPLQQNGEVQGYLTVNSTGRQLDHILELAPTLFGGDLVISEVNSQHPERNGLTLYDGQQEFIFSQSKSPEQSVYDYWSQDEVDWFQHETYGRFDEENGRYRVYFVEYLPYPNQLISWMVSSRVPIAEISEPFWRIRLLIVMISTVALGLGLWLAHVGSRQISQPIVELTDQLKAFARGKMLANVEEGGVARNTLELEQLRQSFQNMATSVRKNERERESAERMLFQSAKLASIGEMAAGIGHEINNPLNNILSLAKLARRDLPEGTLDVRADLDSLIEEAYRASDIVRGLLDFSRQREPEYGRIKACEWLHRNTLLLSRLAEEKSVELIQQPCNELMFEGDSALLQQVLVNLVMNAIQASRSGGCVWVSMDISEEDIRLVVTDQGSGFDESLKDKLFDPFFTTKEIGQGSGLGLSISLGIVQHHGGRLTLNNRPTGGVEAVVVLPMKRPKSSADAPHE